ncbi:CLUMA_CG017670, isoform A [Clunio marinus]|uniref:CLUMA_CG017670, isoform A n=1 Tax=Clunio marinus TaxID=568069 RepID=A0A1J1IY10_9DIPT|nr:CLUMA_CG017670, isoform A [Clunio marinus]
MYGLTYLSLQQRCLIKKFVSSQSAEMINSSNDSDEENVDLMSMQLISNIKRYEIDSNAQHNIRSHVQ